MKQHSLSGVVYHHRMVDNHLRARDSWEFDEVQRQESRAATTAEEDLWYAVLEDAAMILRGGPRARDGGAYEETRRWVASLSMHTGSFEFVCQVLGVGDSDFWRDALLALKPNGKRSMRDHGRRGASPRPAVSSFAPHVRAA